MLLGDRYQVGQHFADLSQGTLISAQDVQAGQGVLLFYPGQGGHLQDADLQACVDRSQGPRPFVRVLGYTRDPRGDRRVLVLEPFSGKSVAAVILQQPLSLQEGLWLAGQLFPLLEALHARGESGVRLAPASLFVEARPEWRLAAFPDLNLPADPGKNVLNTEPLARLSQIAPECLDNMLNASPASDVFALGALLYEVYAGRTLYVEKTARSMFMKIMRGDRDPLSKHREGLPEHVYAAIEGALSNEPDQRHASVAAFRSALSGCQE
jgi:serine/threonine protein kinase